MAPPKARGTRLSRTELSAIAVVALVAIAAVAYIVVYDKPKAPGVGVTIHIQAYGYLDNGTSGIVPGSYAPDNFTVPKGTMVTLQVQNTDNVTHGLAIPNYNVDTGMIKPNATATISFTANTVGFFLWNEPSADCGGGGCDTGSTWDMVGNFTVTA